MDQEGVRQGHRAHRCSFSSVGVSSSPVQVNPTLRSLPPSDHLPDCHCSPAFLFPPPITIQFSFSLYFVPIFDLFFNVKLFFFKESNSLKLPLLMFPAFHHRRRWNNTPSDAKSDCVITAKLRQVQLLNLVCSQGLLNGEANLGHNLYL